MQHCPMRATFELIILQQMMAMNLIPSSMKKKEAIFMEKTTLWRYQKMKMRVSMIADVTRCDNATLLHHYS